MAAFNKSLQSEMANNDFYATVEIEICIKLTDVDEICIRKTVTGKRYFGFRNCNG